MYIHTHPHLHTNTPTHPHTHTSTVHTPTPVHSTHLTFTVVESPSARIPIISRQYEAYLGGGTGRLLGARVHCHLVVVGVGGQVVF